MPSPFAKWTFVALLGVSLLAGTAPGQEEAPPKSDVPKKDAPKRAPKRPDHKHTDKEYMGREIADVMSYLGADWLFRATRVEEERPDEMLAALEIKPGMTVADVGAGAGYHVLKLSPLVGPTGKVIGTDIQPEMIGMMRKNVREAKLKNVSTVLCTATDPKLPIGGVDLILMVDVYHECSDPAATLKGLRAALKPGGRLALVEYRGEDPGVPIKPEHKMTLEQVKKEVEPQGFAFQKVHDSLPWQHVIVFQRPVAPAPETVPPKE